MALIDEFTFDEALRVIGELQDGDVEIATAYYDGDHWQDGDAWIGPRPADDDSGADDVLEEIERGLISKNCVKETSERHRDAVIGKEPDWSLTVRRALKADEQPTEAERALIEEAESALVGWWDKRQSLTEIQDATINLLIGGSGVLRLFVPPTLVSENGAIQKLTSLEEALDVIYPHTPELFQATVYVDSDSQQSVGMYGFNHREGLNGEIEQRVELHGLNDRRQTIIRLLRGSGVIAETQPLELMGHLGLFEMRRPALITPQVSQLQALVNMALTMMGRNVVLGGFLERLILNAQLPGEWIDDPDRPGKKKFQPSPFHVGAGSTNALAGLPIYDASGKQIIGYTNPNVIYRDPVSVQTFKETMAEAYGALLDETKQAHALISKDATASGEARKQAASEFVKSLNATKTQIEAAGRWMIETALAMAAQFAGQPGRFAELRAQFQCRVDLGAVSIAEEDSAIRLKDAGIIDLSTAMTRVGIDDPDAEEAKIQKRKAEAADANSDAETDNQDKGNDDADDNPTT
jgi:hypothetical protein